MLLACHKLPIFLNKATSATCIDRSNHGVPKILIGASVMIFVVCPRIYGIFLQKSKNFTGQMTRMTSSRACVTNCATKRLDSTATED